MEDVEGVVADATRAEERGGYTTERDPRRKLHIRGAALINPRKKHEALLQQRTQKETRMRQTENRKIYSRYKKNRKNPKESDQQ